MLFSNTNQENRLYFRFSVISKTTFSCLFMDRLMIADFNEKNSSRSL